jgi:A/G-specific adenine glycosylase
MILNKELVQVNNHLIPTIQFQTAIITWGVKNFRKFPWRVDNNPYYILISEVMLHRTNASQVKNIFNSFIEKYPTFNSLNEINIAELYEKLHPLGLNWRINLLYEMINEIKINFYGKIPEEKEDLLSLPGINNYIAGAIRCFAWNFPEPLADTNTIRVVGRLYNLEIKDSSRRNPVFLSLLSYLLSHDKPRIYNYALLDLANEICKVRNKPSCSICPVQNLCLTGIHEKSN